MPTLVENPGLNKLLNVSCFPLESKELMGVFHLFLNGKKNLPKPGERKLFLFMGKKGKSLKLTETSGLPFHFPLEPNTSFPPRWPAIPTATSMIRLIER
jgi:hypothetical protein